MPGAQRHRESCVQTEEEEEEKNKRRKKEEEEKKEKGCRREGTYPFY